MSIIIKSPHLCTKVEIWAPKYHTETDEYEVWISKSKIYHASPIIIVEFTRAKHLMGQRFAITRTEAQKYKEVTNGKIVCLAVPMSALQHWTSTQEIKETVKELF